jgi:Swt1-like HEPN
MEPFEAINVVEKVLRELIEVALRKHHGDDWMRHTGLSEERLTKWEDRRAEEKARRPGGKVDDRLISYSHLFDLKTIIDKRWEAFNECLGNKRTFGVYMERLEDFRNAPMHSRELLPFERSLVEGIAGEIRNRVTIYRSKLEGERQFFPRIERIVDSYGSAGDDESSRPSLARKVETGLILHPGDQVSYRCAGWDPDGRDLRWTLRVDMENIDTATGNEVTLKWDVQVEHIGELKFVDVRVASDRSYHRHAGCDDQVTFQYSVLPE